MELHHLTRQAVWDSISQNPVSTLCRGVLLAFFIGAFRIVVVYIYRLTFHPLAKYPGPWLSKVSDAPGAYHVAKGQLHLQMEKAHRQWGSVVRLGPTKLVFNSVTALHEIYHSKDVQKAWGYATMAPTPGAYNIFTAIDKTIHRHKRRVLSQGFSDQSLRAFEPTILKEIDIFVKKFSTTQADQEGWSAPTDMTKCCRHIGYDIMGDFGFGQSFELQEKTENHFLMDAVVATSRKAAVILHYPALAKLHLEKVLGRRTIRMREKYLDLMSRLVKSRLKADKVYHDLFSFLVGAKDPETGEGFTESELWAESRFLLIAGADTTSTALTACFFYLSAYPDCYNKLVSEIRSTFASGSEIHSGPKLSQCHYLRACIDEALRMSPPITGTLWREVCPGGIVIDNEFIPEGYDVGVSLYAVHHNEELFPDSYTFKPERWILSETNSPETLEDARHAFNPFSIGARACAGRNMAYMELSDTLARTIWHLDFRRAEGAVGAVGGGVAGKRNGRDKVREFQVQEYLTVHHEGPFLQFRPRKDGDGEGSRA